MHRSARVVASIVSLLLCSVLSVPPATRAAERAFRAGVALVDITPQKLPVSMTGSFNDRQATQVNDPLHARCLVLDDGTTRLAIVVCDCCLIPREMFDDAKRRAAATTGIQPDHMLMSATHTHTAVTVYEMGHVRPSAAYNEFLTARIAEAVERAAANLQPAKIGWATASLPGEVHNRRWRMKPGTIPPNPFGATGEQVQTNAGAFGPNHVEPAGPTDPEISILAVETADGKPLSVWATYALHYVGNIPPDALSADYFGEFAAQIRRRLVGDDAQSPFVGLLANGASGDINNINVRKPAPRQPPLEQIRLVAGRAADAVAAAYRTIEFKPWASLAAVEREVSLGVRKPTADDVRYAREVLATSDGKPANLRRDVYAGETLALAEWPAEVQLKLQALRIGDFGVATIPCEPFVQIGLDIKAASPFKPTCVVGLANGYNGYLPTPEQHAAGGYETWRCRWSYLETEASRKITATLVELLKAAADSSR